MTKPSLQNFLKEVLTNMPSDWLKLTTHRLDIYNEAQAKVAFLDELNRLYEAGDASFESLAALPTAYDYIRLGHPLSSLLEWAIATSLNIAPTRVISFDSKVAPILAILRKNLLDGKDSRIVYSGDLPGSLDANALRSIYQYKFELFQASDWKESEAYEGTTIVLEHEQQHEHTGGFDPSLAADFIVQVNDLGSILLVNNEAYANYIGEIQHVRRRETVAMTPRNSHKALQEIAGLEKAIQQEQNEQEHTGVLEQIKSITGSLTSALLASSGLSMQYAITMGLVDYAHSNYPDKKVHLIIPTNCYGGTNDQARRVAACLPQVEIIDLLVDGDNNMVDSLESVLTEAAQADAVPLVIAEIPTNPRVEVPDMIQLAETLEKARQTALATTAIAPVFILDQTFCPNTYFLREEDELANIQTIAYVSGSKFPSGGLCTAGYAVSNTKAAHYMNIIAKHLQVCDNEATPEQIKILAEQMPSMNARIAKGYENTRSLVNAIECLLPDAKINFVSEELATRGFTPSVFSLDLPTKGESYAEREAYKRQLNHQLITMMISALPEAKHCVSYGQLKGSYWTIPATSTQGTTQEGHKDYIVRVSCSPNMDVDGHVGVLEEFVG